MPYIQSEGMKREGNTIAEVPPITNRCERCGEALDNDNDRYCSKHQLKTRKPKAVKIYSSDNGNIVSKE